MPLSPVAVHFSGLPDAQSWKVGSAFQPLCSALKRQQPVLDDVAGVDAGEGREQRLEVGDGVAGQRLGDALRRVGGGDRVGGVRGGSVGLALRVVDAAVERGIEVERRDPGVRRLDLDPRAPAAVRHVAGPDAVRRRRQDAGGDDRRAGEDVGEVRRDQRLVGPDLERLAREHLEGARAQVVVGGIVAAEQRQLVRAAGELQLVAHAGRLPERVPVELDPGPAGGAGGIGQADPLGAEVGGLRQARRAAEEPDRRRQEVGGGEVVVRRVDLAERQGDAAARQVLEEIDGELLRLVAVPGARPLHDVERPERAGLGRQHDAVPAEAALVLQRRGHQPLHLGAVAARSGTAAVPRAAGRRPRPGSSG